MLAQAGPKDDRKRLFVIDNDPCQSSKVAMNALEDIEAKLLKIPAKLLKITRPQSNWKHFSYCQMWRDEAVKTHIESENFSEFRERVLGALKRVPCDVIDKAITSLSKRVDAVIDSGGYRSKY